MDLDDLIRDQFQGVPHDYCETVDGDHGRLETRRVWTTAQIDWLGPERERWAGLTSVAVVESPRVVTGYGESTERRYFISTLDGANAARVAAAIGGLKTNSITCWT